MFFQRQKRNSFLGLILWVCLLTKETSENDSSNNTTSYFEGSVSMSNDKSSIRRAIKIEFEKLQNEIETLKAGQQKIENLLNEILYPTSVSAPSASSAPAATLRHFDEEPQIYDKHFNCLRNCTSSQNLSENCADLMPGNQHKFGIYLLNIPQSGLPPFYAYCRLHEDKHWTIIQRRIDGSIDFYRNWHDYKNGFGDLYGEYWLGLTRLHAMTAQRHYELWIHLSDFDYNEKSLYYGTFAVSSEEEGFALTVGNYVGDIDDSLRYNNGRKFSTYDHFEHENFYNRMNCAQTYKSAWWYYDCFGCSLNGEFFSHSNRKTRYGIFWRDWHGYESLRSAQMAIRPVQ